MSLTLIETYGPPQTGKTTLAASLILGALAQGVAALYVAPTQEMARWASQRRKLPSANVTGEGQARAVLRGAEHVTLVVLDDAERISPEVFHDLKRVLAARSGPTQLVAFYGQ